VTLFISVFDYFLRVSRGDQLFFQHMQERWSVYKYNDWVQLHLQAELHGRKV